MAARHCNSEIDYVLKEYEHLLDTSDVTALDKHGNTSIHYLSGTQKVMAYADQLMRLPISDRRDILLSIYNQMKLNCQQILNSVSQSSDQSSLEDFFLQYVVNYDHAGHIDLTSYYELRRGNTRGRRLYELKIDPRLLTVNCYALNMYSLTDAASTILLPFDSENIAQTVSPLFKLVARNVKIRSLCCSFFLTAYTIT